MRSALRKYSWRPFIEKIADISFVVCNRTRNTSVADNNSFASATDNGLTAILRPSAVFRSTIASIFLYVSSMNWIHRTTLSELTKYCR